MELPNIYNTHFLAIIPTVGGMLFGFDISSMSAIIVTDQYVDCFNGPHSIVHGAIESALAAGSTVGALFAGPLSDKIGRRDAIFSACLWWLAGTAIQVACNGYGILIAGRILNGICVGITSSQVPVFLAEIAKKEKRACGTQFVPTVVLIVGIPFLPRLPRWLAKVGRVDKAVEVLAHIQAGGRKDDPLVIAEWEEITTILAAEREAPYSGWRRFVKDGMWRRTFAGMSVHAWQQLSGANVMGAPPHVITAFSYLLIIVYAFTLAPVAWVYVAEVWSLETQAIGMALASVANWAFNFALGLFVPPAFHTVSWKTSIIFGVLCFVAAFQAFLCYPETAQKSLEEIEVLFSKGGPRPWNTRPGDSLLDVKIAQLQETQQNCEHLGVNFGNTDNSEKLRGLMCNCLSYE
ncbi:MAG: hypothetical protein Q9204_002408 [Flavoplaca sp. TL-2023a]